MKSPNCKLRAWFESRAPYIMDSKLVYIYHCETLDKTELVQTVSHGYQYNFDLYATGSDLDSHSLSVTVISTCVVNVKPCDWQYSIFDLRPILEGKISKGKKKSFRKRLCHFTVSTQYAELRKDPSFFI